MNPNEAKPASAFQSEAPFPLDRCESSRMLDRWRQLVVPFSAAQHFDPEAVVISGDESGRKSYLVEKGIVALTRHLETGKQVFLTLRSPGQIFGHSRHVINHSFELTATALTRCVLRVFDTRWLVDQVKRGGEAGLLLLEQHAADLCGAGPALIDLVHSDSSMRLERFLAQFAGAFGLDPAEEVRLNIPFTDGYFASLLGISAQQFSAIKQRLTAQGRIRHVRETQTWILMPASA